MEELRQLKEEYAIIQEKKMKAMKLVDNMKDQEFRDKMFDSIIPRLIAKGLTIEQISTNTELLFNLYVEFDFIAENDQIINSFLQKMQ